MTESEISAKVKKLHLMSRRLVGSLFAGNYHSAFKGPGLEFDEVREYISGDDIRFIDWNVSARMGGTPYSKKYREERELMVEVLIDVSASLLSGSGSESKRMAAAYIFALVAFSAIANDDRVGSLFFSDRIEKVVPPAKGQKHVLRQIRDIFTLKPSGMGSDMGLAMRTVNETLKRRGICIILSDFKSDLYWKELSLLKRRHEVIAIRLTDPLDMNFPRGGMVPMKDLESGRLLWGMGNSGRFRKDYHDYWQLNRVNWLHECSNRGIRTLELDVRADIPSQLLAFFNRRQRA